MAADDVARLVAVLEADIRGFSKNMEKAQKVADQKFGAIERRMRQADRSFASFGRDGLQSAIGRYLRLAVVIRTAQLAMRKAAETNEDAAKALDGLNAAWERMAQAAAPSLSWITNRLTDILTLINDIGDAGQAAVGRDIFGTQIRRSGIPFASAATPFATLDKKTGNYTTSPLGFAAPGVTDVTPKKSTATKDAKDERLEIEKSIAQNAYEIQQHFLEKEAEAVRDATDLEIEIRQHYLDVQQELWAREADELADIHERMNKAWDEYYERQAEAAEDAYNARLQQADTFFGSLATLTRSSSEELKNIGKAAAIIQATIDGVLAVQKALASAPPPINFALAAAVGAAAAVNVAEIAGMEKGGRVTAGTPYIVGEKRPELFVPDTNGRIIPRIPSAVSPGMASGSTSSGPITISIDARGAQAGVADQIAAAMRSFERRLPRMMTTAQRDHL